MATCTKPDVHSGRRIRGEHGSGLSEGQAQRIAIARGFLQPGILLLLDEISASLDEDTEKILMHRLSEKSKAHTIRTVIHRFAILPYYDDIIRIGQDNNEFAFNKKKI